jgi:ABC-type proline/glycine betaine transport system ATPase subunit
VAQKETEALAKLIVRLKAELGLTLVIIEHDIPLIMALADRIVCMADGEVIAAGTPDVIRHDPAVVEAYLGGSLTAIERSTATGSAAPTVPVAASMAVAAERLARVVPGLGAAREAALLDVFGSVDVRHADRAELTKVRGIGPGLAARIQDSLAPVSSNGRG